jgi:hypothetical protein
MLPTGALDISGDASLDLAMRRVIDERVGFEVEYLEQLYTFGDLDRSSSAARSDARAVGVGYLVLTREAATTGRWVDWYHLLPWEDMRAPDADREVKPTIEEWAKGDPVRSQRVQIAFGMAETPWDGVRALDRYELLYEAHCVPEWFIDHRVSIGKTVTGEHMAFDHRRVAATALSRLRGKLTYRPVVFDLMPETFTLSHLQRTVEALAGEKRHTQNFRRLLDRGGLVEGSGRFATTGGRPAELFRFRRSVLTERPRVGVLG